MGKILFVDIPTYEVEVEKVYLNKLRLHLVAEELISQNNFPNKQWVQGSNDFTRGLLTMASYLEFQGHKVGYFRYNYCNKADLLQVAAAYKVIGITAMTPSIGTAIELATALKRLDGEKLIILGGYHATFLSESVLEEHECIDIIVRGEGESTVEQLLRDAGSLDHIPGITYRDKRGNIRVNDNQPHLECRDLLIPLYRLLGSDLDSYRFNLNTTRGCSFLCTFCVNNPFWGGERYRSVDQVIRELDFLSQQLRPDTLIHFSDNIFTRNQERAIKLCRRIAERSYPFLFSCDIRGRYIDKDMVQSMEQAGFVKISIGFEDADDNVLRTARKGLTYKDNIASAKLIKDHSKMLVNAYWMVALPGSTRQSLEYNIEAVRELIRVGTVDTVNSKLVVVYPGTPLFQRPREFGIKILSQDWSTYDRRLYPPVYRLDSLTENEIYRYFLELEDAIIEEYCKKLDLSANELFQYPMSKVHRHTTARYINPFVTMDAVSPQAKSER